MEDNYFDKKLKGILESAPELQAEAFAIDDMRKRLQDLPKPKKRRRGLLFLVPFLLLPVLLGTSFFYKKYQELYTQVHQLHQEISQIKQAYHSDTVISQQIIHHYDTIYNVIYREKYIREGLENKTNHTGLHPLYAYANSLNPSPYETRNSLNWSTGNSKNSLLANNSRSSIFDLNFPEDKIPNIMDSWSNSVDPIASLGIQAFPSLQLLEDPEWLAQFTEDIPPSKKSKANPAYYFVPNGLSFEAGFSPVVIPLDAFGSQGDAFSVAGSISFFGGRSLRVGAEYLSSNFSIEGDSNPEIFNSFPIIAPNDPVDNLHELKGDFSYLQIPVTLRQSFNNNKNLKPFINIGFVASKPIAQKFVYEYLNLVGEYKLNNTLRAGDFSIDNMRFGLGAEYALGKHFAAVTEAQYQHAFSLGTGEYFKLRYFAFNLGLKYQLH